MGDGLKKVAKLCGGLIVKDSKGRTARYDAYGRRLVSGKKGKVPTSPGTNDG